MHLPPQLPNYHVMWSDLARTGAGARAAMMSEHDPSPPNREERDRRYSRQMREAREVLSETANTLEKVREKLRQAERGLSEFGDIPLEDLERKQ